MVIRSARILLEVVAGLVAVLLIAISVALWRLSSGPVSVAFLKPYVESAFDDPADDLRVVVGDTWLVWEGWGRSIELQARDWRVLADDGRQTASFPAVSIQLSLPALLQGAFALTSVELVGAKIRLIREPGGTFAFADAPADPETDDGSDLSGAGDFVLDDLLMEPNLEVPVSYLRRVRIVDGSLEIDDRRAGIVWQAPSADIEIRRESSGLSGEARIDLEMNGEAVTLDMALLYDSQERIADLAASFSELEPGNLARLAPELEPLSGLAVPLSGDVNFSVHEDGRVGSLDFRFSGTTGQLEALDLFEQPLEVASVTIQGSATNELQQIRLARLQIAFGSEAWPGPTLEVAGEVERGDQATDISATVKLYDLKVDDFDVYWPKGVAQGGRDWVVPNIRVGTVEQASVALALSIPEEEGAEPELRTLDGEFSYRDLEVHYRPPLPPATGVSGRARFDAAGFVFDADRGRLRDLEVKRLEAKIYGLDGDNHRMSLDLTAHGPLEIVMRLLDHPELRLIQRLGLQSAGIGGGSRSRVFFDFPLIAALTFDEMEVLADAQLDNVVLPGAVFGQDLTDGQLELKLEKTGMRIAGPVAVAGVPMSIAWSERFEASDGPPTNIRAEVPRIDDSQLQALGLDPTPYMTGPVSVSMLLAGDPNSRMDIDLAANLQEARLELAFLGWEKAAGTPGEVSLRIEVQEQQVAALRKVDVRAGDLRLLGDFRFNPGPNRFTEVDLPELALGDSALSGVRLELFENGARSISVGGGVLDVSAFVKKRNGNAREPADAETQEETQTFKPLSIVSPGLERIIVGEEGYLENVSFEIKRGPAGWERVRLDADVPERFWISEDDGDDAAEDGGRKRLQIDYGPRDEGGYQLTANADDLGATLRAIEILEEMIGGRLELTGTLPGPLPGATLSGRIEVKDYRMVDVPSMARMLTLASFTGMTDTLNGEGIAFQRLVGDIVFEDDVVTTDLIRAYGSALGITAKGKIDLMGSRTDIEGALVPAYSANKLLGDIPVLGYLLTGGKGEGFIAVTYRLHGPLEDPEIAVNPLSALAPGFLRGVFGLTGDGTGGELPTALPEPGKER